MLEINKKNGNVVYNDEAHTYWIEGTDFKCISVTTLIHKFCQPFDEDFWSAYKALEKIMDKNFKTIKSSLIANKIFS